jgi:hypothetical protein
LIVNNRTRDLRSRGIVMRCFMLYLICALAMGGALVWPGARAQQKEAPPAPSINQELRKELLRMTKEDQDARKALIDEQSSKPGSQEAKRVETIDKANTARMKEIVDKHGWPGKSLVGTDGANAAWLLVQHADQDAAFQKRCLDLMREAIKKGEVSGQELAYLTDRVRVAKGEKQLYGTQFHTVKGELVPQPIEDEANVDKRRKEIGLMSMAEYGKLIREMYKKELKK